METTILRESPSVMAQPWGQCWGFGGEVEPGSAVDLYPWQQMGVDLSGSSESPLVDERLQLHEAGKDAPCYSSAAGDDDGATHPWNATDHTTKHHRPSPLDVPPNSRDIDPGCVTSSSTISMASLPQTPDNGQYTWHNSRSSSLDDQLWLVDAMLAASSSSSSQEYLPLPRDESVRFTPYGVLPTVRRQRRQCDGSTTHHAAGCWSPAVANSTMLTGWESSTEVYQVSGDQRFGAFGDGTCNIGLTELPGVEPVSSQQHGEVPNQERQIVERGVPVSESEPGSHHPGIAENGVAPHPPQLKLPSAIHSTTALEYPAVQKDSIEGRRRRKGRQQQPGKPTKVIKPAASSFVCEECTLAKGSRVSFNCRKDLMRHRATTKAHGAHMVLFCSCGKGVTRRDAMKLHRRWCNGHTLPQPATA